MLHIEYSTANQVAVCSAYKSFVFCSSLQKMRC